MDLKTYQQEAARTAPVHMTDEDRRLNCAMGLVGEFGELVDMLKKHRFHGHGREVENHERLVADGNWAETGHGPINQAIAREDAENDDAKFRAALRDEFGDVLWYLAECATITGWTMESLSDSYDWTPIQIADQVALIAGELVSGELWVCPVRLTGKVISILTREGFTLDEVLTANVAKLRARYPSGFSVEDSIGRAE